MKRTTIHISAAIALLLGLAACSAAGILTACKGDDTPASSASTSPEAPASSVSELEPIGLFTVEDFPKLDGSTACIPLMAQMMADSTGIDLEVAQSGISVSTTAYAWENFGLYPDEEYTARMLVVYEAPDYVKEELKEKFFRNDKEKGLIIVNRRVDEYLKYKGFRVLVTDSEKDPVKAWTAYADRWRVEDAFATLKDRLGCNRIRCSDNKALQGKTFVQFIATGLSLMVRSRIRCYMKENKKAGKLNLVYESDAKILQVLNNVMQTRFNHGYYFDEVAGKKIKYFEALGVGVPGAGPETPEDVQEEPEVEPLLGTDIEI